MIKDHRYEEVNMNDYVYGYIHNIDIRSLMRSKKIYYGKIVEKVYDNLNRLQCYYIITKSNEKYPISLLFCSKTKEVLYKKISHYCNMEIEIYKDIIKYIENDDIQII